MAQLHSRKPSLSATLGEEPPANPLTGKAPSSSAENRALGEGFAECRAGTWGRFHAVGRRPTPFSFSFLFYFLPRVQHSGKIFDFFKYSLPSAAAQTLGKEILFFLKKTSSPSAWAVALGKEICFFLKKPSSPSAAAQALGEACFLIFLKKRCLLWHIIDCSNSTCSAGHTNGYYCTEVL